MVHDFFYDILKLRPLVKWSSLFLLSFIICYLSRDFGFFWDNVIHLSIPANWFYSSGLNLFTLPVEYTTLHPPLISVYLFFVWSLFGKTLFVSHMAMFPFVFGFLWQLWVYICWLLEKDSHRVFVFFIVLIDATILSQLSLISFEIALLFFLFAALNSVNQNRNIVLAFAFSALLLVSVRGMMCGASLVLYSFILQIIGRRFSWKFFLAYVPGGLICLAYLLSFYLHRGWLLHNPVSWIENNQLTDVIGIMRNVVVFAWRLVDFGRITIYLFFLYFIFSIFKNRVLMLDVKLLHPLLFACSFLLIFFPLLVIYRNPFGHRYLMPLIIMVTLITLVWILKYSMFIKTFSFLILVSLFIGHFIIYPEKISMGWDSTTAHWPYYRLRKEMIHYIEDENIPFSSIASFFPNLRETTLIDPDDLTHNFNPDITNSQYVFYSNVYNVNDEVIDELHNSNKWILIKEYSNLSVFIRFYKRCPAY